MILIPEQFEVVLRKTVSENSLIILLKSDYRSYLHISTYIISWCDWNIM